jgi:TRAP-type C4-dicarboxylate transport system substrate-binding protein
MILMVEAADEIRARTDGNVNITVYPASQLGDYQPVYEEVMQGSIDMACITTPTHVNPLAAMTYIPFLISDYDEAKEVWTEGSNFYTEFDKIQREAGVKFLGLMPGGLMGIGTAKEINPNTVFDFSVRKDDVLLRLPPLNILQIMADAMQFRTSTIPYADLIPALQTGIVDGWIGGGPELNYSATRDVIKYYYDVKYMDDSFVMLINYDVFNSMPTEYQNVITEVFKQKSIEGIDAQAEKDLNFLAQLEAYGIEVVIPTDAQRDAMAGYMRENCWPGLYDLFGEDLMTRLIADVL